MATTEVYIIFGVLALTLFLRVPVALCLAVSAIAGAMMLDLPLVSIIQRFYSGTENWVLIAIPLFMLAGTLMDIGGLSERLINVADACVGFLPGGLANVNIVSSLIFGGISGSAVADTSAIGKILIPEMVKRGYPAAYTAAITCSSSPLAMIIPPSIPMILWCYVSGESLGDLFLAGIFPGILASVMLMTVSTVICIRRGYQAKGTPFSFKKLKKNFKDGLVALGAPVIIIGGIRTGYFTATEAAVAAVTYAFIATYFYYRELRLRSLPDILLRSGKSAAAIMFIIGSATAFSWVLTLYRVPHALGQAIVRYSGTPASFVFYTGALIFVMGMFLDVSVIILLIGPIIAPLIRPMGLDPIQFPMIIMLILATGLVTPPLGMCLFVAVAISKERLEKVAVACVPFVLTLISLTFMLWYIPGLTLWLPSLRFSG
ncbi:MAG: TRAP transporter large permease [Planctomycetes bacterium]|nr:TRAP transporter large permease [Planctomycetota bacterium]